MGWRDDPTALVAAREIREATRATSFRVTLVISAIALAAIIVVANLGGSGDDAERVVVAGPDAAARVGADRAARPGRRDRRRRHGRRPTTPPPAAAVRDGDADVAVSADGTAPDDRRRVDLSDGSTLATVVNVLRSDLALENGLRAAGLTADEAAAVRATPAPGRRGAADDRRRRRRLQPPGDGDDHQHPAVHPAADVRPVGRHGGDAGEGVAGRRGAAGRHPTQASC